MGQARFELAASAFHKLLILPTGDHAEGVVAQVLSLTFEAFLFLAKQKMPADFAAV